MPPNEGLLQTTSLASLEQGIAEISDAAQRAGRVVEGEDFIGFELGALKARRDSLRTAYEMQAPNSN